VILMTCMSAIIHIMQSTTDALRSDVPGGYDNEFQWQQVNAARYSQIGLNGPVCTFPGDPRPCSKNHHHQGAYLLYVSRPLIDAEPLFRPGSTSFLRPSMLTLVTMLTSHCLSHTCIIAFQESDLQNIEQQISRMSLDLGAPPKDPPAEAAQVKEEAFPDLVEFEFVAMAKQRREDQIDKLRVRWDGLHCAVIDADLAIQEESKCLKDMLANTVCTVPSPSFNAHHRTQKQRQAIEKRIQETRGQPGASTDRLHDDEHELRCLCWKQGCAPIFRLFPTTGTCSGHALRTCVCFRTSWTSRTCFRLSHFGLRCRRIGSARSGSRSHGNPIIARTRSTELRRSSAALPYVLTIASSCSADSGLTQPPAAAYASRLTHAVCPPCI
jgi:hypothetical protein